VQELLSSEEKTAKQLELDRERDSAANLAKAKADCEGITFSYLYLLPLVMNTQSKEQQRIIAALGQNTPL
jgi:hypothetical protein